MELVQESEDEDGAFQHMLFANMNLEYFARWLLMLLDKAEVLEPQKVKDKLD